VVGLSSGVAAVSAGGFHTCAVMTAGEVKCWGRGVEGQIGDGKFTAAATTPQDVSGLAGAASDVSAGGHHTCVVMAGGGVWCWGKSEKGQLGDGTVVLADPFGKGLPVEALGLSGVAAVSAGGEHSLAVASSGSAFSWGAGGSGQLGDGLTADKSSPAKIPGFGP
jgi:alpha-tubulin suppressor-like RCC1 family protein